MCIAKFIRVTWNVLGGTSINGSRTLKPWPDGYGFLISIPEHCFSLPYNINSTILSSLGGPDQPSEWEAMAFNEGNERKM
jgi:hypothetical protein